MRTAAFTGIRNIVPEHERIMLRTIQQMKADHFVSGAAVGVDTFACRTAFAFHPDAVHTVVVPAAPHNEDLVRWATEKGITVVRMPGVGSVPKAYRERNEAMIDGADYLVAFPYSRDEVTRSGTWMTIRIARKAGKKIYGFPLDGGQWWQEG